MMTQFQVIEASGNKYLAVVDEISFGWLVIRLLEVGDVSQN